MNAVRAVYHLLAVSWYVFLLMSMAARPQEVIPAGMLEYGGPWKYLTVWNMILQVVFFGLAVVDDLQEGKKSSELLHRCKDLFFCVVVFPVGTFVVLVFWMICAYDRELVYPDYMDTFIPRWMNHGMPHGYPKTRHGVTGLGAVAFCYLSWVAWLYWRAGVVVYPLLGVLSHGSLVGLTLMCMSFAASLYLLGEKLNRCIWGTRKESSTAKRK